MSGGPSGAPLQLLAGGGIAGPIRELVARFEPTHRVQVVVRFGTTPELVRMSTTEGPFDCGVTPREVHQDAGARAMFESTPGVDVARVGLGVAVKAGAPRPEIGTPAAFEAALRAARSFAAIPESAGGRQMTQVFAQMGIGDLMRAKMKAQAGPVQLVEAMRAGEAELGIFLTNVLTAPGLEVVGPFPEPFQRSVTFTSALAASPVQPALARAFVDFVRSAEARDVIASMGMTPLAG